MTSYPRLRTLLGGWFHQDFDLDGEDVPQIVGDYAAVTSPEERDELAAEIRAFLSRGGDLDRAFLDLFRPDADPALWGMTTADWLNWVLRLLEGRS